MLSSILKEYNKLVEEGKSADEESEENVNKDFRGDFDSYIIEKRLGRGGIGTVYLVKTKSDISQKYAMKTVPYEADIIKEKEVLKIAFKSNSIHLCKIIDSGYDNDMYFIVLDLLGSNLFTFNHQCSTKTKYKLAEQCLIAIEAFHKLGYIHRDIKSDNFALGRKGSETEYVVFIIDFGMCRKLDKEFVENKEENYKGTLEYGSIAAKKGLRIGRKHDIESWFYMIAEWFIGYDELPWQTSPVEYLKLKEELRDENSKCFKDFFGVKCEKLPVEFVKILRYIDKLGTDEEPDYNKIIYFLQQAYQKECKKSNEKEIDELLKKISVGREFVAPPKDLAFFSEIEYDDTNKKYTHIEHHGISLLLDYTGRRKGKIHSLKFKCTSCINGKGCGLYVTVAYNDKARLWDEAKVTKITDKMDKCMKLQKLSKSVMPEDIKELKTGDKLESWKILTKLGSNLFKVVNIKKNDKTEYALKFIKFSSNLEKFKNEKRVLMEIAESNSTKLCELFHDGEKMGYSFIVTTLLGPDLEALRLNAPAKKLTLRTTLSLGIECIDAIEELHAIGYIHNKITPKSFALELKKPHQIILHDFELASKILTLNEDEEKPEYDDYFKPGFHFVGPLPVPKNDLESLCYVLSYVHGEFQLPNFKKEIPRMRQNFDGVPSALTNLTNYIKCLPNSSTFDYNYMKRELMNGLEKKNKKYF